MVAKLVRRAQAGDAEAYTELVRRFQDAVFATAYEKVLDVEAARDIAQETFIRAYELLGTLRDLACFPSWIVRISRNLATSWLRKPEREWVSLDGIDMSFPDTASTVVSKDLVARALSALSNDNRLALSLFLVNGYSYQEVADLTDVPVTTVKGRIERARRKLSEEVLQMTEDTLKSGAPDQQFTLDTVRKSMDRAREAVERQELSAARAMAEEALEALSEAEGREEEQRTLRLEGLGIVRASTYFADKERWQKATREALRICEDVDDRAQVAQLLYTLVNGDRQLTRTERDALEARAIELFKETNQYVDLGGALFFRGWHHISCGKFDEGFEMLEQARDAIKDEPYMLWHACLDASDDFQTITGGQLDRDAKVNWGAGCDVVKVQNERLCFEGQPGFSVTNGTREETAKFMSGFDLLWQIRWLPYTGPQKGWQEEISTFSYTGNPTHTRIRIESEEEGVSTPAGEFEGCLLVRAETTESPLDADNESRQRELNKIWCGQHYCWLARGVGPVAYRHERADGITVHTVLSKFECPEEREEWVPLVLGTRWEHVPAEPPEDLDALMVSRLTHIDEDGKAYITGTTVGNRKL